jgi:hypothetical protein
MSAVKRFDDWPTRLDAFIESRKEYAFSWGGQDCCLFACDCILEMTGEDLVRQYRNRYHDAAGAQSMLENFSDEPMTVGSLASEIAKAHGIEKVPVSFAQRGDVVLVLQEERESLGVVSLAGDTLWAPEELGLAELPLSSAIKAWRI